MAEEGNSSNKRKAEEISEATTAEVEIDPATGAVDTRTPVTVLTGFLGSGKTTLLNHILTAKHGWRIAVIENEFGEVGIDDSLLRKNMKEHTEEEVIEMLNGCVCCTVRDDLIKTLKKLAERQQQGLKLDAIVIETTGMADPAPVAQTFFVDDFVQEFFKLDGIVTLVDANHIEQHLDEEKPEGAENESVEQVAFADRLILNKIDLVPKEEDLKRVETRLRTMNAFAPIIRTTQSSVSAENVLNLKAFNLNRTLEMDPEFLNTDAEHEHDESVSSLGINVAGEVDMSALSVWMDDLLREQGADIFRMKGVLACQGYPKKWAYQAVHMIMSSVFSEDWAEGEERCCKLTFIGKNLNKTELKEGFMSCMATAENREKRIKSLRFAKGDKVQCVDDDGEWVTGVVEDHLFRNEDWAPGECAPYAVKLDGAEQYIYPTEDDDTIVRAAPRAVD